MRAVAPVVRVNPVAYRDVAHLLRNLERAYLVGRIGLFVDRVWRPHQRRAHSYMLANSRSVRFNSALIIGVDMLVTSGCVNV